MNIFDSFEVKFIRGLFLNVGGERKSEMFIIYIDTLTRNICSFYWQNKPIFTFHVKWFFFLLFVIDKPEIKTRSTYTVEEGDTVELNCIVSAANPNTSIVWRWVNIGNPSNSLSNTSTYRISNIQRNRSGTYSCNATNSVGSSAVTLVVNVQCRYNYNFETIWGQSVLLLIFFYFAKGQGKGIKIRQSQKEWVINAFYRFQLRKNTFKLTFKLITLFKYNKFHFWCGGSYQYSCQLTLIL